MMIINDNDDFLLMMMMIMMMMMMIIECLFVCLLYVPSQQLWSLLDGQFT